MADASFSDFQTAINGFNNEVKSYAINNAISNASQQVKQLQQTQLDEVEKRNQLESLSGQLALQLTGAGATGAQIQGAFNAIQPKALSTPGAMFSEGLIKQSKPLQDIAMKTRDFMDANKFEMAKLKMTQESIKMSQRQELAMNKDFQKLVPQVQERYNKSVKSFQDKIAQIDTVMSLPQSSIKNRLDLTTLVKSVGQDVGNIGEKEAEASLGTTAAGDFKRLKNYIVGAAESAQTPEQAFEVLKIFKKSKSMMDKVLNKRAQQYGYQLSQAAKGYGHDLSVKEAMDKIVAPTFDESQFTTTPNNTSNTSATSAPSFDIKSFMTPIPR